MKIRPNGVSAPQTGKAGPADNDASKLTGAKANALVAPAKPAATHEFSSTIQALRAQVAAGDVVDHAKVARVSQSIQDGTFRVDAEVVADRMIQGATDLLAKHK